MNEPNQQSKADSVTVQKRPRRWWFRLAAFLSPLLLLLVAELILRFIGYGYPASFFLKSEIAGQKVWIDNPRFTESFFPRGLARASQPFAIPTRKPPGTFRIFVLGESAAMGDPEPAFSFGRILEVLLEARFPDRRFEVVNTGITAINSHVIQQIARDCTALEGDLWIVYMGHNEVVGPFGAGTVLTEQAPSLAVIRANLALKSTRLGQWLDGLRRKMSDPSTVPTTWQGMEMFVEQQVRESDPRMAQVHEHFEKNLESIIALGRKSGTRVLVGTAASNLRDSPPFASLNRPGIDLAAWQRLYAEAATREEAATNAAATGVALARFLGLAHTDSTHAELQFRIGRSYIRIGELHESKQYFQRARDLDTLRFRADTRINHTIRQTTIKHDAPAVELVDIAQIFERRSPLDLPGEEFFYEHVHLNFQGNYLLARSFAERIASQLPGAAVARTNATEWLPIEECARRLAFTDWHRYQVVDEVVKRLQQPPFTQQLDHQTRLARYEKLHAELRVASRAETFPAAIAICEEALKRSPDDWALHENFAKLLQAAGDPPGAEKHWRRVLELMPHHDEARHNLADVIESVGRSSEASLLRSARPGAGLPSAR